MSAGHRVSTGKKLSPDEVAAILSQTNTARYLALPFRVDEDHDVSTLAGYSVDGRTIYLDRDFIKALKAGRIVVRGMSPDKIKHAIVTHEHVEKSLLDADNNVDDYKTAHNVAEHAEDNLVKSEIGDPQRYEDGLQEIIEHCWHKPLTKSPKDLDCTPLADEPDARSRAILKELRKQGVDDAFKLSKLEVNYSTGSDQEQCGMCSMYQGDDRNGLCATVGGRVWVSRWCKKFYLARLKLRPRELLSRGAVSQKALDKVRL